MINYSQVSYAAIAGKVAAALIYFYGIKSNLSLAINNII